MPVNPSVTPDLLRTKSFRQMLMTCARISQYSITVNGGDERVFAANVSSELEHMFAWAEANGHTIADLQRLIREDDAQWEAEK